MLLLAILLWGIFAGWLAHVILYPGTTPDWPRLLIAGFVGSFIGGLIGSVIGAIIFLLIDKAIRNKTA